MMPRMSSSSPTKTRTRRARNMLVRQGIKSNEVMLIKRLTAPLQSQPWPRTLRKISVVAKERTKNATRREKRRTKKTSASASCARGSSPCTSISKKTLSRDYLSAR